MMEWTFLLIVLALTPIVLSEVPGNITRSPCTDKNHMFLAPGVLASGGSSRACLSRFHTDGPARVTLTLTTEGQETVTASRELPSGDGGCLDISVPQLPNTKAEMNINVWYPEDQCSWQTRVPLRIGTGRVMVVHTERARYRPGDIVRVRMIMLNPDLTPIHGQIDQVWFEGPRGAWEGSRAAEWTRVRSRLGIALVQYTMDDLAPPGRWTVRAKLADGSQGAAAFWVGNYELPPFQLSVRHAPRVLRTSERMVWTVCVRYPWTEAVEGMLVIRIRGAGTSNDGSAGIRTAVRLRAPRACHRHAAAVRRIGLDGVDAPDVVVADFSFQEEGTRIWQNTTVVSQVVNKAVTLEFLTKHRAVISPEIPYKLKVKATRWDDKPASKVKILVCRAQGPGTGTKGSVPGECKEADTDDTGIAKVMFAADHDGSAVYKFEATLKDDRTTSAAPLFLPVQRRGTVHVALGPVKTDPYASRSFVPLYLNMKNVSNAITAHFVVITRGGIIYRWGATTQCPTTNSAEQIQTAPRNSPCSNFDIPSLETSPRRLETNKSDALLDRHLLRVMLPIKVTHQMCPDSHLVAYFYLNGELVSASKHLEMEECLANKVEATWSSRQTPPGSTVSLQLSTPGPALCALTALDAAAKWIQPLESVKDVVLQALKRLIEGHRNLTEYDTAGECFLTSDSPELPTSSTELTAIWLASAGVRVVGGGIPISRSCGTASPMPLTASDLMVPRSDFSEAWLWRLVAVGTNGTATTTARAPDSITRYEATALCVSRNGIAVSPPAALQVFREFFVHADSTRRVRRGDFTIVRYRLFNYLYEPLSVQLQILTDPHLEISEHSEMACISARASIARRIEVRARLAGNARISVRAKSFDGGCPNVTSSRSGVSDEVIIAFTVESEGVPIQEHKSILLCGRDSLESRASDVMWNWSAVQAVPGTETLTVWAAGDTTGPLLADADDLVLLPRGCGEQNMARMATNLLALKELDPQSAAAATAREHVARGFTRQLQYVHPSGGFSAFGASDAVPSTWLTAFAVRYLRKTHQTLTPGLPAPPALYRAEQWLLSQQMENGCFRNDGQVFHRELRGGLDEDGELANVALTAYVITSLAESAILSTRVLHNALSCLRALPTLNTKSPSRIYAHSLLSYAFMRLKAYEEEVRGSNEASLWKKRDGAIEGLEKDEEMRELVELLKMAKRSGDFVSWETGNLATSIEATGYALLALSRCPAELRGASCAHDARAAVRWLSAHRSASGGFLATQDTLVALEALTAWSKVQPSTPVHLNVTARSDSSTNTVVLQDGSKVPEVMKMGAGNQLKVHVEGSGCALIQSTRSYNSYSPRSNQNKQLSVEVSAQTDGAFNCDVNETHCYCAAVVKACVVWSGVFPEMALMEVSLPGGFGADAARLYAQLHQNSTILRRIELTPSSSKATLYLGTRDGSVTLGRGGHQCFEVHAVGPQTKTKPAYARIQDYYRPDINDTQMYSIPEECHPRITHESNQYLPSDNLFNKAKSLSNSDEIIITNEFSFEDIPEGIPLEDPLYDNNIVAKLEVKETANINNSILKEANVLIGSATDVNNSILKEANVLKDNATIVNNCILKEASTLKDNSTDFNNNVLKEAVLKDNATDVHSSIFKEANILKNNATDVNNSIFKETIILNDNATDVDNSIFKGANPLIDNASDVNNSVFKEANLLKDNATDDNNSILKEEKILKDNVADASEQEGQYGRADKVNKGVENVTLDRVPRKGKAHRITGKLDNFNDNTELTETFMSTELTPENQIPEKAFDNENEIPRTESEPPKIDIRNKEEESKSDMQQTKSAMKQDYTVNKEVMNPNLADFHVIDSEKDLEVPAGIEGPIPVMVLPPQSFNPRGYVTTGYPYIVAPKTYQVYNPAIYHQTYFYQPGMEDTYRNKFRYSQLMI